MGILDNQNGCVFSKDSIYTAGESCAASVLADLDNDNDLDAVILRGNNDDVAVLLNYLTTAVDDNHQSQPHHFALVQNYPNPFNPVTTIEYSLPKRSRVTIDIFNIQGQKVKTLIDRNQSAGSYSITWDGVDAFGNPAATGIYLYRLQAGDHGDTKKMLLLK